MVKTKNVTFLTKWKQIQMEENILMINFGKTLLERNYLWTL